MMKVTQVIQVMKVTQVTQVIKVTQVIMVTRALVVYLLTVSFVAPQCTEPLVEELSSEVVRTQWPDKQLTVQLQSLKPKIINCS